MVEGPFVNREFQDFYEIIWCIVILIIGLPSNIMWLIAILRRPYLNVVKLFLAICALYILCFQVLTQLVWQLTYSWKGAPGSCQTVLFLRALGPYALAYMMVIYYADVFTLRKLQSQSLMISEEIMRQSRRLVIVMIALAWLIAIIASIPQLYVWRLVYPFGKHFNYAQCTTIWTINTIFNNGTRSNEQQQMMGYGIIHLGLVFVLPVCLSVFFYGSVIVATRSRYRKIVTKDVRSDEAQIIESPVAVVSPRKLVKLGVILGAYVGCWVPYCIVAGLGYSGLDISKYGTVLDDVVMLFPAISPYLFDKLCHRQSHRLRSTAF